MATDRLARGHWTDQLQQMIHREERENADGIARSLMWSCPSTRRHRPLLLRRTKSRHRQLKLFVHGFTCVEWTQKEFSWIHLIDFSFKLVDKTLVTIDIIKMCMQTERPINEVQGVTPATIGEGGLQSILRGFTDTMAPE